MKVFLNFTFYKNSKEIGVVNIDNSGESTLGEFLFLAIRKYNTSNETKLSEELMDYSNNVIELKKYSTDYDTTDIVNLNAVCKNLKIFNFAVLVKDKDTHIKNNNIIFLNNLNG